jgi:hypothetical protein
MRLPSDDFITHRLRSFFRFDRAQDEVGSKPTPISDRRPKGEAGGAPKKAIRRDSLFGLIHKDVEELLAKLGNWDLNV